MRSGGSIRWATTPSTCSSTRPCACSWRSSSARSRAGRGSPGRPRSSSPPIPGPLDNVLAGAPIGPRLLTALAVVALYARRLVWPLGLSADYSYRQVELATGLGDPGALAGLGVVVGAAALAAWGWRHERHVCLALALAALPYSIVSNVFVTIGTVMAERLLYLPSAGFCLLVASATDVLGRPSRARRVGGALFVAALVAFYVPATMLRNRVWRERRGFFEAMVASAPRSAR